MNASTILLSASLSGMLPQQNWQQQQQHQILQGEMLQSIQVRLAQWRALPGAEH